MSSFKKGDYFQITRLYTIDEYLDLKVGDIFKVEKVDEDTDFVYANVKGGEEVSGDEDGFYIFMPNQLAPIDKEMAELLLSSDDIFKGLKDV